MATTLEECEESVRLATESGLIYMMAVGHCAHQSAFAGGDIIRLPAFTMG